MAQQRDSESGLPIKRSRKKNKPSNAKTGPKDPQSGLRGRGTSTSSVPEGSFSISQRGRRMTSRSTTAPAGSHGISEAGRKKAAQNRQEAQSRNKPSSRPASSGSKPTPRKPTRSPQAGAGSKKPTQAQRSANYKAWAKAHPDMAAKLKKGMSGYSETRGSSSSTSSRPQRGGDGAPGAQSNPPKSGNKTKKAKTSRLAQALQGVKRGGWKKRGSK